MLFAPVAARWWDCLKLARFITGNSKVVSLWDAFHGASSMPSRSAARPVFAPVWALDGRSGAHPPPTRYRGVWYRGGDDLHYADYLEYVIEKEGGIGAFIAGAHP